MQRVVFFVGLAEAMTGILLLLAPSLVSGLLFGADVPRPGTMFAQLAGIALIGLGIACWPGPAALGMLIYGVLVGLYLVWVGATQDAAGPFLWPAVILHAALAVPLAMSVRQGRESHVKR